mgnify:CR=1 FL=1
MNCVKGFQRLSYDEGRGSSVKQIDALVGMCIRKGYVSQGEAQWLRYALEKRVISLISFGPLLLIGFLLTNPATVLTFFVTFCLLRTRTNGFHAKSICTCILYSILGEILFLRILPTVWNNIIASISLAASIALIWFLAPYNHPNMDLSSEEVAVCAKSAKLRLSALCIALIVLYVWKQNQLTQGIHLGIIMTALTLVIAYCSKRTI